MNGDGEVNCGNTCVCQIQICDLVLLCPSQSQIYVSERVGIELRSPIDDQEVAGEVACIPAWDRIGS